MTRALVVMSVLVLTACSESLDIQLESEVTAFLSNGYEQGIRLTPQDNAHAALRAWLQEHKSGWYPTSGHYPGGVYVKSGDHGIQITTTHVVLYSTTSPEPRAMYIQKVGSGELGEIRNLGK